MKKIEAVIHPDRLPVIKEHLAKLGIDSRLTVSEVSTLDSEPILCSRTGKAACPKCVVRALAARRRLKLELIVGDRQAHRAVDILVRQARPFHESMDTGSDDSHLTILEVSESLLFNAGLAPDDHSD